MRSVLRAVVFCWRGVIVHQLHRLLPPHRYQCQLLGTRGERLNGSRRRDTNTKTHLLIFGTVRTKAGIGDVSNWGVSDQKKAYIKSMVLLSASENSITSMPSPVYLRKNQKAGRNTRYEISPVQESTSFEHGCKLDWRKMIVSRTAMNKWRCPGLTVSVVLLKTSWMAVEFESAVAACVTKRHEVDHQESIVQSRTWDWPTGGTDTNDTDTLSGIHLQKEWITAKV